MISIAMPVMLKHSLIEQFTREAVEAVQQNTASDWELTICLHGGGEMAFDDPRVKVLTYPERLSIATAYNEALRRARGNYICCLHNDTQVRSEWDLPLIVEADQGNIAFPFIDESQGFCELRGIHPREDWLPSSCCFLMSRRLWEGLGGYDEQFAGMHFEDTDLWHRAQEMGARLKECPPSVVLHHRGVTRCLFEDKGQGEFAANQRKWWLKYREDGSKEPLANPRLEGY